MGMMVLRRGSGGGVLLLGQGDTAGESQCEGGGKQKAVHEWCSLKRLLPLSEGIDTLWGECCAPVVAPANRPRGQKDASKEFRSGIWAGFSEKLWGDHFENPPD